MTRTTASSLLIAASLLTPACAFESSKPIEIRAAPLAGRWCAPEDLATTLDGRALEAEWTVALDHADRAGTIAVERRFDGVVFERQTWEIGPADDGARLVRRTIETPEDALAAADEARVKAAPLDELQALADRADPWASAVVVARAETDDAEACDVLPSAYGHGYPRAEGWYVTGAADAADTGADDAPVWDSGWYGHGGESAEAPFAVARSREIVVSYDDDERMTEEWLDRGAVDGGPHDLMRSRAFDHDGAGAGALLEDRIERWSPTPKEDVLRVLDFSDEGPHVVRRVLSDTFQSTLDVRFIPRPGH